MNYKNPYRWLLFVIVMFGFHLLAYGDYSIPAKPIHYITDTSNILTPKTVENINAQLVANEQATSNQVLVYIQPELPEGAEIGQYCTETFHAWKVGQKGKDNGVILFIFNKSHKAFIATGRGLEGALPDAVCSEILRADIVTWFKQGNFDQGISLAVNDIIKASKGEYQGNGKTVAQESFNSVNLNDTNKFLIVIFGIIIAIYIIVVIFACLFPKSEDETPEPDPEPYIPPSIPRTMRRVSRVKDIASGAIIGAVAERLTERTDRIEESPSYTPSTSSDDSSSSPPSFDSGSFSSGGGDSAGGGASADW